MKTTWRIALNALWFLLLCLVSGFFGAVIMTVLLDGGRQLDLQERGFRIGARGGELFDLDEAAGNAVHRSWLYASIDGRLKALESLVLGKQEYEMVNATIAESGRYIGDGMHIPDYIGQIEELVKERELRQELNLAQRVQRLESMYLNIARQKVRERGDGDGGEGAVRRTAPKRVPFRIPKDAVK